ncbi:aldo/keto reductase [uncultured Methanobrevibacter sp.]|uniref:aldo/keto reductase n=1 Tax=uncultured Methanobrevibacter sp. TaxID=253161 RepID=UPI0025EECB6F|nr:aldo/keto reductase [uncultured Methanobrevibacter sp.]
MRKVTLGKTKISVEKNGFGALPIQRISIKESTYLLQKAYNEGIDFYDTARLYTDSEKKIGIGFEGFNNKYPRESIILASKSGASKKEDLLKDLDESLNNLQTDYLDIYQLHNPSFLPKPSEDGLYDTLLDLKEEGKIRHIGITTHKYEIALEAIKSQLYETIQYPFSYISDVKDLEIVEKAKDANIGFIAMKAMAGGLLRSSKSAYAYLNEFDNVVPIWGVQRKEELNEFLSYMKKDIKLDDELSEIIKKERRELAGDFCRGCGYCSPCSVGIEIFKCARMSLWIRRMPSEPSLTDEAQEMMMKIEDCTYCGKCMERCPYELNIPELLEKNLKDYKDILSGKVKL